MSLSIKKYIEYKKLSNRLNYKSDLIVLASDKSPRQQEPKFTILLLIDSKSTGNIADHSDNSYVCAKNVNFTKINAI
jgi:hypothetical protein